MLMITGKVYGRSKYRKMSIQLFFEIRYYKQKKLDLKSNIGTLKLFLKDFFFKQEHTLLIYVFFDFAEDWLSSCFQYRLGFQAKRGNRLAKILRFFAFHSLTKNAKLTTIIFAKFCIVFTFIRLIHLRKKIRIFTKTVCEIRTKVFVRWNPSNTD